MRKHLYIILLLIVMLAGTCFFACNSSDNDLNNNSEHTQDSPIEDISYIHTQSLKTIGDFNGFFSYSFNNAYVKDLYQIKFDIEPRIKDFVEYEGKVCFEICATEKATDKTHDGEIIDVELEYTGKASVKKQFEDKLPNRWNSESISYQAEYEIKLYSVDIEVTYHNEGLSGDYSQTYKTIEITRYNYTQYCFGKVKNAAYYVVVYYDNGDEVELTINGLMPEDITSDGKIIDVKGTIDIYPDVTE